MNAHADMFIVVGHNELNTPRSIYRNLVSGVRKFPVFKSPKQAPINAFKNICLLLPPRTYPSAWSHEAKVKYKNDIDK